MGELKKVINQQKLISKLKPILDISKNAGKYRTNTIFPLTRSTVFFTCLIRKKMRV